MSRLSSFLVRHAASAYALKTFAAAMLAFTIALWLEMPRPFWAMTTVFITAHPLSGATLSKAVYRIAGTLIGGAGTIALVPNLVNAPELLSLAIALWIGVFTYLSLIDGTPRAYVYQLAAYTIPLLGFPIVSAPELTFDIVVSRVQEILLGIIVASAVSALVLPRSVASAITAQADAWLAGARRLSIDIQTGRGSEQERDSERKRLAAMASGIDELYLHLDYETAVPGNTASGLRRLRRHMLALRPLLAIPSRDHKLALWSAGGVALAVLACCAFWIATGWADGASAALIGAVVGALFAGVDEPLPAFGNALKLMAISIAIAGIYLFGVLPRVTTIEVLIAALMPTFVLFGWMTARPATARVGYVLALFTSVQLSLQSSYAASFESYINSSIALILGLALTGVIIAAVRALGAGWAAKRAESRMESNVRTLVPGSAPREPEQRSLAA